MNKYEDALTDARTKLAASEEEVRQLSNEVNEDKQMIHELQMEVNTLKGQNNISINPLNFWSFKTK